MARWPPGLRRAPGRRLAAAGAILLVAAGLGYVTAFVIYPAPLVSRDQRLDLVIGLPVETAQQELEAGGFRVKVASHEPDPTLPAGYVSWQEPPGLTQLPRGSLVELTVSDGPSAQTVPDLLQFDADQARRILTAAGFGVGGVDSVPASAEAGVVIATRPAAGTPRDPGSSIGLVVSRGPAALRVPNLVGLSESAARAELEGAGLRVGIVRTVRPAGRTRPGFVVEQRPRPGTLSARGGRVDLTVTEVRKP